MGLTLSVLPVQLKVGDDISTDDIIPAGARVMPFWSNIEKTAEFAFEPIDNTYPKRAANTREGHAIVAGNNYGQGSSRENAAFAPRYLGLRLVIARSFARIHWQNLSNFGVLPLTFAELADYDQIAPGAMVRIGGIRQALLQSGRHEITAQISGRRFSLCHDMSQRQIAIMLAGGIVNWLRARLGNQPASARKEQALLNPG